MDALWDKRVILVTGKGGVGRSTVSAALTLAAASLGKRVVLSEIEEPSGQGYSPLARTFGLDRFPHDPTEIAPGARGVMLNTTHGTELFLTSVLKVRAMARLAMRSKALLRLLHAAPSFHEMGIFYHLLTLMQAQLPDGRPENDLVLLDMPATGHALALTALPEVLLRLVSGGPMAQAMRDGQRFLNDPATGAAWVVTLPEPLPVSEALELVEGLEETNMPVGGVIANRLPPNPFEPDEWEALGDLNGSEPFFGETRLRQVEQAQSSLDRLHGATTLPVLTLDELALEGRALAEALARGLVEATT